MLQVAKGYISSGICIATANTSTLAFLSAGSSERLPHGPLFLKALTEASGRPKAASKAEASRKVQTVSTQDVAGPDEAEAAQAKGTVDEDAKRKKEHKHKHKSKKRHKEKQAKQDK